MQKLSRRQVTSYIANQLVNGAPSEAALAQLAAYLVDTRQTKQASYYVADIEKALADAGQTMVDVYSARALDSALRQAIESAMTDASRTATIREHIDASLIGGVIIKTPKGEIDASLRGTLQRLKTI